MRKQTIYLLVVIGIVITLFASYNIFRYPTLFWFHATPAIINTFLISI